MTYHLKITFTNDQLNILYVTGSNVVIAKPTGSAQPNVAWQVIKPFQSNTVSWPDDNYGLYTSVAPLTNGIVLAKNSATPIPATKGGVYTLTPSGSISGPTPGGNPDSYSLINEYSYQPFLTAGLYQNATVNNRERQSNILTASPLLYKEKIEITPSNDAFIWLQSQVISNTYITNITAMLTKVDFTQTKNISISYDSNSGKFIEKYINSQQFNASNVSHIEPQL